MKPIRFFNLSQIGLIAVAALLCMSPAPAAFAAQDSPGVTDAQNPPPVDAHGYLINDQGYSVVRLRSGTNAYFRYDEGADVYYTPGGDTPLGAMVLADLDYTQGYRTTDPRALARAERRAERGVPDFESFRIDQSARQDKRAARRANIRKQNGLDNDSPPPDD